MAQWEERRVEKKMDSQSVPKNPFVRLEVVDPNDDGRVSFKLKRKSSIKKLLDAYCVKKGLVRGSVRFTFDGQRIDEKSTPTELEMDDGDIIDVMVEQTGG